MIIPLQPRLEGLAERRFFSFARQMLERQDRDPERIGNLVEDETMRVSGLGDLKGQSDEYEACVRVLGDLAQLRWTLVESGYGLELHSPRPQDKRVSGAAQARERKEAIRNELRPRLLQQFADPNVGKFIDRMERPPASARRKSIRTLIADGAELQDRLSAARRHPVDNPARIAVLRQAVRPYLQLVDAGRDGCTNILLRDIWRYFRYTWSIPQTPIPGRSLLYLARDAAHEAHAVIGIAAQTAVMRAYEADAGGAPTLKDVLREYADIVGDRVDAPYSILDDLVGLEVFVERSSEAERFDEFFASVTVIDLAALGIGEKERNMLLVLFLNLYYEYMINLVKQPYLGRDPQLRFIDSMLLVDEADNIMKYNFEVLRQVLLQGREFGVGVVLASQFLSHFRTRETDYAEPLLTWFIHKVPNVTSRDLQSIGLNRVASSTVDAVKSLDVHRCLYKTLDVPGRFMQALPFYEVVGGSAT